jgi:predicted metalloprotease with PDZ domain
MKKLEYCVCLRDPGAHIILMTVEIADPDPQGQEVSLARWVPGSYLIRELSKNIIQIRAFCDNQPIELEKLDNSRWRCAPAIGGSVRIEYEVYAWDNSVRGAHFDTTHAFIEGARLFLKVEGFEAAPCTVHIEKPLGDSYQHWRVATSMSGGKEENSFKANNYEELIDHPFEIGIFEEIAFNVCDIPHRLVVTGQHYGCLKRLVDELTKVCTYYHQLLRTPTDLDQYTFLLSLSANGYGGLEHCKSSACQASRYDIPLADGRLTKGQISLLGLLSHEYFHLWNVKRMKPAVFMRHNN